MQLSPLPSLETRIAQHLSPRPLPARLPGQHRASRGQWCCPLSQRPLKNRNLTLLDGVWPGPLQVSREGDDILVVEEVETS